MGVLGRHDTPFTNWVGKGVQAFDWLAVGCVGRLVLADTAKRLCHIAQGSRASASYPGYNNHWECADTLKGLRHHRT
jgi:hypothetical protein